MAKFGATDMVSVEKLIVSAFVQTLVVDIVLAAQRSILCFVTLTEVLAKSKDGILDLIGGDQRFPLDELHKNKCPGQENVDGSDTEDEEEDDEEVEPDDDDDDDEDFSGEEGGEDDDIGDPDEDPVVNGNGGKDDDDDDEDGDDGDEDEDSDEEEEDEEDEDEEDAPPAKKRK